MSKVFNARIKTKNGNLDDFRATDIVLYQGELAIVKDGDATLVYVGDGVTPFTLLSPIFDTRYIVGIDKMQQNVVRLDVADWVNNEQVVNVPGVSTDEANQLIIPTYSQGSKDACVEAGIDFYVKADGQIAFTCLKTPDEPLTLYVGIFGARNEADDDKPIIRTDIDENFSTSSENPLQNKVVTKRFDDVEASIRSITGDGGSGDNTSLAGISNTLNGVMGYNSTGTIVGKFDDNGLIRDITRFTIPFTVPSTTPLDESDVASVTIPVSFPNDMDYVINASWSGRYTDSGAVKFISGNPVILHHTANSKVTLLNLPMENSDKMSATSIDIKNGILVIECVRGEE